MSKHVLKYAWDAILAFATCKSDKYPKLLICWLIRFFVYFQLEAFLALGLDLGPANQAFQQAKEKTVANVKWIKTNYDTIETWLRSLW